MNVSLQRLIVMAYSWPPDCFDGPDWLDKTRFDLVAGMSAPTPREGINALVQELLADRFKLKVHREKREVPAYELTIAPEGLKMTKVEVGRPMKGGWSPDGTHHEEGALPTYQLIAQIRGKLDRPISDQTGLTGIYQFSMDYVGPNPNVPGTQAPEVVGPDFVMALRKQLGLTLEPKKASVEFLVVDSVERVPTEN